MPSTAKARPGNVGRRVLRMRNRVVLAWHRKLAINSPRWSSLAVALLTGARVGEIAGICREEMEHLGDPDLPPGLFPARA